MAGTCQKLLLFLKKIQSVKIIVTQESVFLMVKYKSLIAVCSFTTKLSLCLSWLPCCESAASVELGASHRVPQKNKWVSCLSIVRYWVSGLECGQCAKVAERGERSLVFLTCWDEIGRGGVLFFTMSNFTNCKMSWWFCCLFLFLSFLHRRLVWTHVTRVHLRHAQVSVRIHCDLYIYGIYGIFYGIFFFLTRGARLEEQGWRKEGGERTMVMDGWLVLFFMYNKMDYWAAGRRQRVGEKEEWKKNAEWQKDQCLPNKQLLAFASVTLVHVATTARKVVDTRIQIHSIPIREEK